MIFNSFEFLAFFSLFVPVYYFLPPRYRWGLLVAGSLFFYASLSPAYALLLLFVALLTYLAAAWIDRTDDGPTRKAVLACAVGVVLGTLGLFKYFDFLVESLETVSDRLGGARVALPRLDIVVAAGLSFYAFSCVSYLVDVYRRVLPAERHLGRFVLYVAYFPKLLAGPIERARPFLAQAATPRIFSAPAFTAGLQLMLWGLFKKVVIADRLAPFVDRAYGLPAFAPPADLVIATYFFAIQLYCDFSGYSDIAIGASRVLGYDLAENFRRPYFSTSVAEFWGGRWHLSLATWFRDYLYIPLGGNRVSPPRHAFNVMAVFLVSGLWHGASWTFVVWGGLNGLYQVIGATARRFVPRPVSERAATPGTGAWRAAGSAARATVTFHLILISWVFFRAATLSDAVTILRRAAAAAGALPGLLAARLSGGETLVSVALIALVLGVEALDERRPFWDRLRLQPVFVRWAVYYAMLFSLIVLGRWNVRQFVYMQF